jgi:hypothetical protein
VVDSFIDAAGYPDQTFSATPVLIDDTRNFTSVSVGGSGFYFHACGLEDGTALCWGCVPLAHVAFYRLHAGLLPLRAAVAIPMCSPLLACVPVGRRCSSCCHAF